MADSIVAPRSISNKLLPWLKISLGTEIGGCAVCGAESKTQHAVNSILDSSTGKINELFRRNSNVICPCCASMWQKPKVWHRSILLCGDRLAFPLIAPEGTIKKAESKMNRDPLQDWKDRPTWRDLIRDRSWWNTERYAVLTTDGQRRIWCKARASRGENLAVVLHDMGRAISEIVTVNLNKLVEILDLVELIYSNGYSKTAIETTLFANPINIVQSAIWEKELIPLRSTSELMFAVVIAQKDKSLTYATNPQPTISTGRLRPLEETRDMRSPIPETKPKPIAATGRKGNGGDSQLFLFG